MPSGQGVVERARKHIGEDYKFVNVPKDDASWRGPWDCAEFVSWLVYQEAGVLYGCDDDKGNPHTADAWTGHWKRDIETRGIGVSVAKAAATVGGILLRFPPNVPGKFGHIVVSDGHGGTIEAMGKAFGVRAARIAGRQWDAGILLPELSYDGLDTTAPDLPGPSRIFAIDAQNMNPLVIERIQRALKANGFDPGDVDGKFGPKMEAAVVAFQDAKGLVVDGDVGEETAESLGIGLAPITIEAAEARPAAAAPSAPDISVQRSLEPMGPLIPIALQLLPGLVGLIAGDKSGAIQDSIAKAVTDIAGTTDAAAARQKIDGDPAAASELRVKLAQIAADAEDKRNQVQLAALKAQQDAQFATLKSQQDAQASRRSDELDRFKAALQDTEAARSRAYAASQAGGPAAWAPIIISLIVTIGFFTTFFILIYLLTTKQGDIDTGKGSFQLVNLTLGALVAAFTTVVSFWLGSSQGSRLKDVATADAQVAQTRELNQTLRTQTETLQKTQSESLDAVRQTSARIGAAARPQVGAAAVRRSNFPRCVDIILGQEGGFSNRSDDPGGATNLGITIGTLTAWRKDRGESAATVEDVRNLTRDTAAEIYRTNYWNVLRCDDLPAGVDLLTFDMGVNAGPGRAAKILQKAVGAEDDGSVGSATIAAAKVKAPLEIINQMTQGRLDFYRGLPTFATFGVGWTNRTHQVQTAATTLANEAEPVA